MVDPREHHQELAAHGRTLMALDRLLDRVHELRMAKESRRFGRRRRMRHAISDVIAQADYTHSLGGRFREAPSDDNRPGDETEEVGIG
jgi:hypothetical protein